MCDEKCEDTNRKKILLVDDDADFITMNRKILEENGYEVSVAYSGKECLEHVQSERPDLILLDMMMETWSEGNNVVDHLRGAPATKKIPIVLITAVNFRSPVSDITDTEDFLEVDEYLTKPILPEKLLEHVKKLLEE